MKRLVLLFSFLLTTFAFGQTRPTVGIVLSGGGAKGFAHIGVLEILDSLGIPVDAIGGTSMGSIIGGLYAIGHKPEDLEQLTTGTEWDFVTNPRPERRYLAPYEKNSDERYILNLDITKEGVQLPGGLNPGERILNILSRETIGYHDPVDFTKDLPIPFVCVATELNTGREKVMRSGILPLCLRSSMSIPSLFSPFYYDHTYLIDGGTVNNFPADHLRQLGVDYLIGVDVQTTFADSISDPTFFKVLEKTSMYMNAFTTKERESLCNLIIRPDMTGYGVTSFDDAQAIIEAGKRAARANMSQLLRIRDLIGGPQPRTVNRYIPPHRIRIDEIRVKGLVKGSRRNVMGNLGFTEGDTVSFDEIEQAMLKLHGTKQFSLANYLTYPFQGKTVLEIRVVEVPSGMKTRVGIRYDSEFESAALINFTSRNNLFAGSFFSVDAVLSVNPRIEATYLWDHGSLPGFGMDVRYWNYASNLLIGTYNAGEMRTEDFLGRLYVTTSFRKSTALRLGAAYHSTGLSSQVEFIDALFNYEDIATNNLELFFNSKIDIRNRNTFATKGILMDFTSKYIISLDEAPTTVPISTSIEFESNISLGKKWTLRPSAFGLVNIGSNSWAFPYTANYGGLGKNYINHNIPFYGYAFSSAALGYASEGRTYTATNSAMLKLDLQYEWVKNNFITFGGNAAAIVDDIQDPFHSESTYMISGVKLEYGVLTFFGPISVAVHKSFEQADAYAYVNIGFWF